MDDADLSLLTLQPNHLSKQQQQQLKVMADPRAKRVAKEIADIQKDTISDVYIDTIDGECPVLSRQLMLILTPAPRVRLSISPQGLISWARR